MSSSPFIVYVETNWLVACVLPQDTWSSEAFALLLAAERGECTLRIPEVAFVEARHVVERETQDHAKAVTAVAASFEAASRRLRRPELLELARKIKDSEASYHLANPRHALEVLVVRTKRFGFCHPLEEQVERDKLRPMVSMRGHDLVDMHILAAISADRAVTPGSPAAVLSANSGEFSDAVSASKLPRDFYVTRKLAYSDRFDLASVRAKWRRLDHKGWPVPKPPNADPRVQEGQKILNKLPEEKRDVALDALRNVRDGA